MTEYRRYVGIDQHQDDLVMAVAQAGREKEEYLGRIPNREEAIGRWLQKMGREWGGLGDTLFCYEAGPCGYGLYRQMKRMKAACEVVAPSLVPRKPGDRVKTNRRDAGKLARSLRAGDLTAVWVPDEGHEALRDVVRAREGAQREAVRERQRLKGFLLRHGAHAPYGVKAWSQKWERWLDQVQWEEEIHKVLVQEMRQQIRVLTERVRRLEQALREAVGLSPWQGVIGALQCLRGIDVLSAMTLVAELGESSRFATPRQLMSYAGVVPGEDSTGHEVRHLGITKAGNAHVRRVIGEAAHHYRHNPAVGERLARRQRGQPAEVIEISWRAQKRLNQRYRQLLARGKDKRKVVIAVARELLGFIWEIMQVVELRPV